MDNTNEKSFILIRDFLKFKKFFDVKMFEEAKKKFKFSKLIKAELTTYYDVCIKLFQGKEMTEYLFNDICLIGYNLKSFKEDHIYYLPLDCQKKLFAIPSYIENEKFFYSKSYLINYGKKNGVNLLSVPEEEKVFKNYMELVCSLLMSSMFINYKILYFRLKNLEEGFKILGLREPKKFFLNFTVDYCKIISIQAKNHNLKKITTILYIDSYIQNEKINKNNANFLVWQLSCNFQDLKNYFKINFQKECAICLESVKKIGIIETCLHKFCFTCIIEWNKIKKTCPICRNRIRLIKESTNLYFEDKKEISEINISVFNKLKSSVKNYRQLDNLENVFTLSKNKIKKN